MAPVTYHHVTRRYPGSDQAAVDRLDLDIADGEFLVLVGPSGSGKTTALRMLAGLEDIDEGEVAIGGRAVTQLPPKDRDIAMVFQSYALYPHMTVRQNMAFALQMRRTGSAEIDQRVTEAARLLDLTPYLDRKPKQLSGGQRQRVAMGRAIVREPAVFLMDEPLSNLDAKLRVETRAGIAALQQRLATTTVYVTHDQVEAMTMGHRVAVLKDGALQQVDTPARLYARPANAFVAGFIGSPPMNLHTVPVDQGHARLAELRVALPHGQARDEVTLGIRPESLRLVGAEEAGFEATVELVEELGADAFVHARAGDARVVVRVDGRATPAMGQAVRVGLRDVSEVHLFDAETGLRL
ncbi:ABC transporter ATP-binding protein [Amycolatopsis magusensis]|uniref:Multiple sugar transport system ATP-binding protein n=1 Tax=Amycolatopsis magusensis TaxID=882444 RepID=A0ABS4PX81_9PSEU|nr:sn-glycerol-3-phosphate ABC transporter ATP-binding protein UgpC [Amycolatopsis magusensis]MBP2184041.1 multiple sugar transport system ATP-binding protein [Amycolatopsis magusensis]